MNPFLKAKYPELFDDPYRPMGANMPEAGGAGPTPAPAPQPQVSEYEKMIAEDESNASRNKWATAIGAAVDSINSAPSFAEVKLGMQRRPSNIGQTLNALTKKDSVFDKYKKQKEFQEYANKEAQLKDSKDPNSKRSLALKAMAPKWGIEVSPEMSAYDIEQMIDPKKMFETSAQSMVNLQNQKLLKDIDFQNDVRLKMLDLQNDLSKKTDYERLPEENKTQIQKIADNTAQKRNIRNSIEASLKQLQDDELSYEQKVTIGKQLIKTLNSDQGADAVGAEEAKRLAGFLEFQLFNFTEPGPVFGRDLGAFTDQVRNTSNRFADAINANEAEIDRLYNRQQSGRSNYAKHELGETKKKNIDMVEKAHADSQTGPFGDVVNQNGHKYKWDAQKNKYIPF